MCSSWNGGHLKDIHRVEVDQDVVEHSAEVVVQYHPVVANVCKVVASVDDSSPSAVLRMESST